MLILQRKKGQSLTIGNEVTITISEISSDSVKLAINAPKDVLILRSELVEAAEENKAAAKTIPLQILSQLLDDPKMPKHLISVERISHLFSILLSVFPAVIPSKKYSSFHPTFPLRNDTPTGQTLSSPADPAHFVPP